MNLSMHEAASHLKIGKTRLYQIVREHKIQPTRRGRRNELSSEQLDNLKNLINFREPEPAPSTEPPEPSEHFILIDELRNQNKILLQQLEREQEDRRRKDTELSEQISNFQKMLMFLQQDNAKLRNQLLEAPKQQESQFEPLRKEETSSKPPEEPPPAAKKKRGSRFVGLRLLSAAAIIGALFYTAVVHGGDWLSSSLEERISAALKIAGTKDTR
jgi:hypothetical protein